ncbi:MAG: DUF4304 domain-containing protein [Clostridia bacterium]|nr:DUF4304 domain-containing protein [Clostridia bacterium]
MKSVSLIFNRVCKQKYQPLGFVKSKSSFIRVKGDIIQSFSFKRFRDGHTCTVDFGVFPLCARPPINLDAGAYEVDGFIVGKCEGWFCWEFDPFSDESKEKCIESISEAIDSHVIPFFERCIDTQSALTESTKLEELLDLNRKEKLKLNGMSDMAKPLQERLLMNPYRYYMALKSRDFSYVKKYLEYKVSHLERCLKEFETPGPFKQPECVKESHSDSLAEYTMQLYLLYAEDFDYFDKMIEANEKAMREYLASKYPKAYDQLTQY